MNGDENDQRYQNFIQFEDSVLETLNDFRQKTSLGAMDKEQAGTKIGYKASTNVFGIHNIGNTCFFNSTMQAMNATRELVDAYLKHKEDFNAEESILSSRKTLTQKLET